MKKIGIFRCFYCDKQLSRQKKTRDHLQPKSRNGSNRPNNIVNACRDCNQLKGSLTLDEFRCVIAYRHGIIKGFEFRFPGECSSGKRMPTNRKGKWSPEWRKSKGLCVYCPNEALSGKTYCQTCKNKTSVWNKDLRNSRKQAGMCISCGQVPPLPDRVNCEECAEGYREYHHENKRKCFDHYGRTCVCCDEEFDERFLTLDHVNNDGAKHREEIGNSTLYKWAIDNGFPATLQTNCWNCNMGKAVNDGVCPHKEEPNG